MSKKLHLIVFIGFFTIILKAQTITEFSTGFTNAEGIAVDSNNNVFVSEFYSGNIYELDANGTKSLIATTGARAHDIAFDSNDMLHVAEPQNKKVLKIDIAGNVTDFASFIKTAPYSLDFKDNILYTSTAKESIVKVNSDLSTSDYTKDLYISQSIAFDSKANLFVADFDQLLKITPNGTVITIASNIKNISGVAISPNDDVYFTTYHSFPKENKILKYEAKTGSITDFVTTNLDLPKYIAIDTIGNMYVINSGNGTVIQINDNSLLLDQTPALTEVNIPDSNFKAYIVNTDSETND